MELVSRFDNAAINTICVNNVAHSQRLSCIRQGTKAKIHVIFFSPEFLKFLEDSPLDAYYLCWSKFEVKDSPSKSCMFPQELLKRIQEVIVEDVHIVQDIVVVPQFLKKVESKGHIITKQVIHLSQEAPKQTEGNAVINRSHPSTQEELYLDEQKIFTNPKRLSRKKDTITKSP
ncbi:DBB domain-containing protein [Trichonephila inaurata madagascariensis]|uniref:DBB domain-containing protein n=1 Tax=Trichonephila inaurata madagascariensis TaxID=2747483 RepID=A0A8X6XI66_9ARAC|nr:DBB domain-containing protein [Trichonephila inaurata madagascariensis]